MPDTGYNYDDSWSAEGSLDDVLLTTGGAVTAEGEISCDGKGVLLLSFDIDYSNDPIVTGGLQVYIRREVAAAVYETRAGAAVAKEFPFTQNGTVRDVLELWCGEFDNILIEMVWANASVGSTAAFHMLYKFAAVPAAS